MWILWRITLTFLLLTRVTLSVNKEATDITVPVGRVIMKLVVYQVTNKKVGVNRKVRKSTKIKSNA